MEKLPLCSVHHNWAAFQIKNRAGHLNMSHTPTGKTPASDDNGEVWIGQRAMVEQHHACVYRVWKTQRRMKPGIDMQPPIITGRPCGKKTTVVDKRSVKR